MWQFRAKGNAPIEFTDLGRWWSNNAKLKSEAEIDIMGVDNNGSALFCECKWINDKVDVSVLDTLIEQSKPFHYKNTQLCIFAKTGFTKICIEKSNELSNIFLLTYKDVLQQ